MSKENGAAQENKIIHIALVGCGRISNNHIKAILYHKKQAKLVALCDTNKDNLESTCELINKETQNFSQYIPPRLYSDFDFLLEENKEQKINIDLIVLATPSGLHAPLTIKAARSGINVCTEKPMATNWEDAKEMIKECKSANVKLFVVKQNRFNATIKLLKKQVESNRFGKISLVTVNVFWQRPQSYYDRDEWRGTWALDGGALMNQASHYVDLLYWLNGDIKSISAQSATIGRNIEVEDTLTMNILWDNGSLGTMAVTMLTYPENIEGSFTILGEKGSVRIGGKSVNTIDFWKFEDQHDDDLEIERCNTEPKNIYGFGHYMFYKNILDDLQGGDKAICSGDEGLKSLEIIVAAYKSVLTGEKINLPLT
tara:strand:+ start:112 stop:1221 length:1110 start_codon:yes stop_codon:yes gene_type:complete